jgi:hypothetical protein
MPDFSEIQPPFMGWLQAADEVTRLKGFSALACKGIGKKCPHFTAPAVP